MFSVDHFACTFRAAQYDYRRSARTKATFHSAIRDPFHRGSGKPGRRSVECRLILTFDPEPLEQDDSTANAADTDPLAARL